MQRITSKADLLKMSSGDPWIRWGLPDEIPAETWSDGTVAMIRREGRRPGFWVTTLHQADAANFDVRSAVVWLLDGGELDRAGASSLSVPQGQVGALSDLLDPAEGRDWEWMWTDQAPTRDPREEQVVTLDDLGDAEEIREFSGRNNPRVWADIGSGHVRWLALRDDSGALLAVGGAEREDGGAPHLTGIVSDIARRREGLGTVISAALTRRAIAEFGVCSLGMFSDNDVARRVYHRLGYQTARLWSSRRLFPRT